MKKIAAVVVTYNRKKLLLECINALKKAKRDIMDIYIIDNASTDGTYDEIKELLDENTFYFNTGKNLGGAGGFAYGCNKVYMKDYDYCWIMDDDTIVKENSLESLLGKASVLNNKFSYLASVVEYTDGSIALPNAQVIDRNALKYLNEVKNNLFLIKRSTFVSCFVNCKIGKEIGLPIKEMFIYGDDTNYTMRLSKIENGYLDTDSYVIHKMSSNFSNSLLWCEDERISRWKYGFRNDVYNAKKNKRLFHTLFVYNLKYIVKILLKSKSKRLKRINTLICGTIKGLFFNPKIITEYSDDIKWY